MSGAISGCQSSEPPANTGNKDAGATGGARAGGAAGSSNGGASGSTGTGGSAGNGGSGGSAGGTGGATAGTGGTDAGGNPATGGAGGSQPAADGGGSDAPPLSSPGCTGSKATFCEDFDKQIAGGKPTGTFTVMGSVVVDSTRAFSGKQSAYIHLNNPGSDTTAQLRFTGAPLFPALAADLFGRAMVYMNAVPGCCSTSNGIHWDLTTAKAGGTEYTLGSMYGNFMPVYQPGDDSVDTKTKWPEKKWVCIQWEFKGTANYLDVKVDGVRAMPGIPVTKWKPAMWSYLDFGWINFQPSSIPVDMWIDDLAFGPQEIACPAASAP
ncbi:MAG TPA: hypothetical protein VFH73_15880 [Polyangia bacterium]|nr:hypothetical protein [Polyangia bacterium]